MFIPFHLERRTAAPVDGLLLPSGADAVAACAILGHDPPPTLFATADGVLILLDGPADHAAIGAIKLRRLSDYLLIPFDAELLPQLHRDEMAALTKTRGLVILPGGRALEFAPDIPLDWDALLAVGTVRRDGWERFPQPRRIAEELRSIHFELPQQNPEDVVSPGGAGIGVDPARPAESLMTNRAAGRATLGVGRAIAALGGKLGIKSLQQWGQRLVESAIKLAPRLQEEVSGKRDAALRELLRRFQEGDVEGALRRALPFSDDSSHRGEVPSGSELPNHDLNYSLRNILPGSRPASMWNDHDNELRLALQAAYRKAAQAATDAGDFRRAAFIFGKLLSEWRSAAEVLARGDLHRDAAILFRDKIGDKLRAAREFADGGAFEEALAIYEELNTYELAGDLFRRIGNEVFALANYERAAAVMLTNNNSARPGNSFSPKPVASNGRSSIFGTVGTGGTMAAKTRMRFRARFIWLGFTRIANRRNRFLSFSPRANGFLNNRETPTRPACSSTPSPRWPRIRRSSLAVKKCANRCLLALAAKLRDHAATESKPGEVVPALFGATRIWEPAAVRDAAFALKSAQAKPKTQASESVLRTVTWMRLATGTVTATAFAAESGDLFAGFLDGTLACFNAKTERIERIEGEVREVRALAVNRHGNQIAVVNRLGNGSELITSYLSGDGQTFRHNSNYYSPYREIRLSPTIETDRGDLLAIFRQSNAQVELIGLRGASLSAEKLKPATYWTDSHYELLLPSEPSSSSPKLFAFFGPELYSIPLTIDRAWHCKVGWFPHACTLSGAFSAPPLTWSYVTGVRIEFAGLGLENTAYLARISLADFQTNCDKLLSALHIDGYRCVAIIRPGFVAAVTGATGSSG